MFWKLIGRNLFYPVAIFLVLSLWLLTTESGCRASFSIVKNIIPGELKIQSIKGSWLNKLTLKNFEYENTDIKISAEEIKITPETKHLLNAVLQLSSINIKNALFTSKNKPELPLWIAAATGNLRSTLNRQSFSLHIQNIQGDWLNMPLTGNGKIEVINNATNTPLVSFKLGENKLEIKKVSNIENLFDWSFYVNTTKKIKLNFSGTLAPDKAPNKWSGKIIHGDVESIPTGIWQLKNSTQFKVSSKSASILRIIMQHPKTHSEIQSAIYIDKEGLKSSLDMALFFLPKQSLTLRNLHLNITGKPGKPFALEGTGLSGEEKFLFDGTASFNPETSIWLNLTGENLKIYNTHDIQITASPDIKVNYIKNRLFVNGTLQIHQSAITVRDQKNIMLLSRDVVLAQNLETSQSTHGIKIIPNLAVIINNQLYFNGYGIDAIIGGKLTINERSDGLLTGSGKLTIKEGRYRLQGATRYIHRGHLVYPPGTLLKDPLLDILISQNRVQPHADTTSTNVGIYVQGTLQNPIYHPYSNDSNLKSGEILSRLGFGRAETSGDESQRQLFAQTAFLFSGTANPFIDFLQKNLQLEEFNLESQQTHKTFYTQGGTDTVLVVGKSLTEKLYLQYLKSIMEPITTIRLKYFLSRYFTVSAETGSEGIGGDLTFSMERD